MQIFNMKKIKQELPTEWPLLNTPDLFVGRLLDGFPPAWKRSKMSQADLMSII